MRSVQNSPVHVELKPDRDMLDPNFNGYKLSLEKLPMYRLSVTTVVDQAQLSEQQYSLQHVKLFAVHNHIFSDPFNPFAVYIVDKAWTILRVSIDLGTGRLEEISEVWRIPNRANKKVGRFNITVSFPDDKHALISDGCQALHIVKTGDRNSTEPWNPLLAYNPFTGKSSPEFAILDSIIYKVGNHSLIDVLAVRVDDKKEWTEVLQSLQDRSFLQQSFLTVIEWLTFQEEGVKETKWTFKNQKTLLGHRGVEYAHLEPSGTGIYIASESKFYMVSDSEKPIDVQVHYAKEQASEDKGKPEYLWTQTMKEVKIWFKVPFNITKADVDVEIKRESIIVSHKGRCVLEGPLNKPVEIEGSYWIIDTPKCLPADAPPDTPEIHGSDDTTESKQYKVLEIILEKKEQDEIWVDEVVKGNSSGGQLTDPELVEAIHSRLAHLCSDKWGIDPGQSDAFDPRELEECDDYPADSSCLVRIDRTLQKITHLASLGSHQWLFKVRLQPNNIPPAICIRHDVDGIIWKPQLLSRPLQDNELNIENVKWQCEHVSTFSALGYVQASKQQRKYTLCSSDVSYVAICDVKKHIYVYRQPSKIETCLRNRKTGQQVTHVAKQLVISLEPPEDILGAYATPLYLYVLTPENFHAIKMLAEEE